MKTAQEVKDYALKNYTTTFTKKEVYRDGKGKITSRTTNSIDPIVLDCGSHWSVSNHVNGSPIILSKEI